MERHRVSIVVPDSLRPCLFVDRDGVLIEDRVNFAKSWEEVQIFERSIEALRLVAEIGMPVVVITNQSLIGRGLMSYEEVAALNMRIVNHFRDAGAAILDAYFCPHSSEQVCDCRKPKPGLLLRAAEEHGLDLSKSLMVGDATRDALAAEAAGARGVFVRTGQGPQHLAKLTDEEKAKWPAYEDLLDAVKATVLSEAR